jgi:hypothetical protein
MLKKGKAEVHSKNNYKMKIKTEIQNLKHAIEIACFIKGQQTEKQLSERLQFIAVRHQQGTFYND